MLDEGRLRMIARDPVACSLPSNSNGVEVLSRLGKHVVSSDSRLKQFSLTPLPQ
jgi:hypothetical protein